MEAWEHVVVGSSVLFLGIVGTVINGFILYGNYVKHKHSHESNTNSLVVNLALSNLGIIFFAFPFPILASFKQQWFWGDFWCTYYGSASLLFGFNIMITMLMLALDVFLKYHYAGYETYKTKTRKLMIFWGWLNSIFWSGAPLVGWSRISYEPSKTSCTVDLMHPDTGYISYIISCFLCCYLMPIVLMFLARITPKKDYAPVSKDLNNSYQKIFTLLLLFIVEWSPYCVVYIWPVFDDPKNIPLRFSAAAPVFAKLSVVLTPLVYLKDSYPLCGRKRS